MAYLDRARDLVLDQGQITRRETRHHTLASPDLTQQALEREVSSIFRTLVLG